MNDISYYMLRATGRFTMCVPVAADTKEQAIAKLREIICTHPRFAFPGPIFAIPSSCILSPTAKTRPAPASRCERLALPNRSGRAIPVSTDALSSIRACLVQAMQEPSSFAPSTPMGSFWRTPR